MERSTQRSQPTNKRLYRLVYENSVIFPDYCLTFEQRIAQYLHAGTLRRVLRDEELAKMKQA